MSTTSSSPDQNAVVAKPFGRDTQSYQVMNNTEFGKGQLFALDPATGEYEPVGNASGFSYNALAYDINTDFLYAIAASGGTDVNGASVVTGTLIQIDKDGNTFAISDIAGGASGGMIMADVVDGVMFVGNNKTRTFYAIDVTTGEATELTRTDNTGLANDLAAVGSTLYGVSNNNLRIVEIEGTNIFVTSVSLTGGPTNFPAGAIWAATNDNGEPELYAFDNNTGDIYRIDGFTGSTPNAVKVSTGFSPSNSNDGARNPEAVFEVPVSAPEPEPAPELAPDVFSGEGVFTAGDLGNMTIDYLYDGGKFQSEIAVFSLEGMESFEPGTEAFVQEAARRALTGSEGHVVIKDSSEGARFTDSVDWEHNYAHGKYNGIERFAFEPSTDFAIMLVQNTSVNALAEDPSLATEVGKKAFFSVPEANLDGSDKEGRIVDFNGLSAEGRGVYAMEDISLNGGSDHDYNDIVFQITGAAAKVEPIEGLSSRRHDFKATEVGQKILEYGGRDSHFSDGTFKVDETGEVKVDFLFDGGGFNKGELGIFNLRGMESYAPDSEAFLQEAARRAISGSHAGHVVIQDRKQAARFQGDLGWERNFNGGLHRGEQTYDMQAGDQFALILSQNISLAELVEDPSLASEFRKQAIFSIAEANPGTGRASQIVDLNGLGDGCQVKVTSQ